MRPCATALLLLLLLAIAVHKAAPEVAVCSLPSSALYIADGSTLVACVPRNFLTFSARCRTACSCRRLEIGQSAYGVCLNSSVAFDCDAAENATRCTRGEERSPRTANIATKLASNGSSGGIDLKPWQWVLIGLAIALVVGLLLFVFNFLKNRPLRGDNRSEIAQTLELRRSTRDVNLLPIMRCKSQARTATSNRASASRNTTRSNDTNKSQTSDFPGGSYRTRAGNLMSSTLTDTEIVMQHQERAFSPNSASSHSARSSESSQGVDTSTMPYSAVGANRARGDSSESHRRPYPSLSSYSISSDMDSFSSQLTVDGSDTETRKSIEF